MTSYDTVRTAVLQSGSDARVEVNQRALIDKILARYASQGAVYRELLQNSNDAEAQNAEIRFRTKDAGNVRHVSQVVYRNDGHPFKEADWSRLRNIAEGNPDVSKVGAFGVGAYTMFSICEEPLVISADTALAFSWRGDALWVRSAPAPKPHTEWTTFVLPSRDPYPVPDLVPFAQFLCASLTFTNSLHVIRLYIDDKIELTIKKEIVEAPTIITPPRSSSWFSNDGMVTVSPNSIFTLGRSDGAVNQSVVEISVSLDGHHHSVRARYISAVASVRVPNDMLRRIERVTKKCPPPQVSVHVFIDASARSTPQGNRAAEVTHAFSPSLGAGRVFIGFRTSQTTGLAAHLAGPLIPTVEREAIDFQDRALKVYNSDLLFIAGILMRLTLEHAMSLLGNRWVATAPQRLALERKLDKETATKEGAQAGLSEPEVKKPEALKSNGEGVFGFVRFMTSGVKRIAEAITSGDVSTDDEDFLNPPDARPLSDEERDAIMLMKTFSPQQSTPDHNVGALIASGFVKCMPKQSPPVLTMSGVVRAIDSRLPFCGIEVFVKSGVIRKIVFNNAENFLKNVAGCRPLTVRDLSKELSTRAMPEEEFIRLIKWWVKFLRVHPETSTATRQNLRNAVNFMPKVPPVQGDGPEENDNCSISLTDVKYFREDRFSSLKLPMPQSVLSLSIQEQITLRVLRDLALTEWFTPLPFSIWAGYIINHSCLKDGRKEDADVRIEVLVTLSKEHARRTGHNRPPFEKWLNESLSKIRCLPFDSTVETAVTADCPSDLYLPDAQIGIFEGLGSFRKVSSSLEKAGVSKDFLIAIGARKAIAIDFLLTHLDNLKWNQDPEPLISYLRTATLSIGDFEKLRTCQYLPEAQDKSRTYSPKELHLPNEQLSIFPFVKMLQWPGALPERSPNALFLKKLGCQVEPPLERVLRFVGDEVNDDKKRMQCLEFVAQRLGSGSVYEHEFGSYLSLKFLPAVRQNPLEAGAPRAEMMSPMNCFCDAAALVMGFPVLDPKVDLGIGRMFGDRFRCPTQPNARQLIKQLLIIVTHARKKTENEAPATEAVISKVVDAFSLIFRYLASRAGDLTSYETTLLRESVFIPHRNGMRIEWFKPEEVYFKTSNDDIGRLLCKVIDFDPFLASVGVRSEPAPVDLMNIILSSPVDVLVKLGSEKYLALFRRLSTFFESSSITPKMRRSPFLIAYGLKDGDFSSDIQGENESAALKNENSDKLTPRFCLARAEDICIIDNSFFARMFPVLTAPQESDLERFYGNLGADYITKRVRQDFQLRGKVQTNTEATRQLSQRLEERLPLLISPKITSRPLRSDAATMLSKENVTVHETSSVVARYSLRDMERQHNVSCCAKLGRQKQCNIYITKNVDWFDVGTAIGGFILQRCQLEDSFFVGSILEAPLHQLRARGFPVDRILMSAAERDTDGNLSSRGDVAKHTPNALPESQEKLSRKPMPESGQQAFVQPKHQSETPIAKEATKEGYETILKGMFPNCDNAYIKQLLGSQPTLQTLQDVASRLADFDYPKQHDDAENLKYNEKDTDMQSPHSEPTTSSKPMKQQQVEQTGSSSSAARDLKRLIDNGNGFFNRAFRSRSLSSGIGVVNAPSGKQTSTQDDSISHRGVQRMLEKATRTSKTVSSKGVKGSSSLLSPATSEVPESILNDSPNCDLSSEHDLIPFLGGSNHGKTTNGLRVFTTRGKPTSETFVNENWAAIDRFSIVLHNLCHIFKMRSSCVAIYHEPTGRTIAFNANGGLHFNSRYYINLNHDEDGSATRAYGYWYTTMAHELAHNMVQQHSQEHGFFTESYISNYLPELISTLPNVV